MTGNKAKTTCISAPGKVLVAGGYLVLDQAYEGLVLATSSRFYTVVRDAAAAPTGNHSTLGNRHTAEPEAAGEDESGREGGTEARITVTAAQFPKGSSWSYLVSLHPSTSSLQAHDLPPASPPQAPSSSSAPSTAPCSGYTSIAPRLSIRQTTTATSAETARTGRNKFIEVTLAKVLQLAWEAKLGLGKSVNGGNGQMEDGDEKQGEKSEQEWLQAGREVLRDIRGQGQGEGLEVFVLADNDFYSQRESLASLNLPPTLPSLQSLPTFNPLPRAIGETNKTGLGSSAALVTSLTAALLQHLDVSSLPSSPSPSSPSAAAADADADASPRDTDTNTDTDTVHALAQLAHCTAQGKVGSGFDVSSAVYGSHVYRRFDPKCIAGLMEAHYLPVYPLPLISAHISSVSASSSSSAPASASAATTSSSTLPSSSTSLTQALARSKWDHSALPFRLPSGLRLVLADVDAGTDTPSFVGKVLKYGTERPEEKKRLYSELERANKGVKEAVQALERLEREEEEGEEGGYAEGLKAGMQSGAIGEEADAGAAERVRVRVREAVSVLAASLDSVRAALRALGDAAGVPIEPAEQTRLLDASCKIPGVIGGGVPGAGGYDALFVIALDQPETLTQLQDLWASWTELKVSPLLAMQSDAGLAVQDVDDVRGLGEALARCDAL